MKKDLINIDFEDKKKKIKHKKKIKNKINNVELELKLLEKKIELEKLKLIDLSKEELKQEIQEPEIPKQEFLFPKMEIPKQQQVLKEEKDRNIFIKILLSPFLHFVIFIIVFFVILNMIFPKNYYMSIGLAFGISLIFSIASFFVFKENKAYIPDNPINNNNNLIALKSDYEMLKKCPLCSSKLIKSKIMEQDNKLMQNFKCKNPYCMFQKTLEFKK